MTKNIALNAGGGKSHALGARIRAARKSTGLNQAEFGKKLGVSQPAISNWESGREKPHPSVISQLAEMTNSHDIVAEFIDASGIRNVLVAECKSLSPPETGANEVREIFQLRDPSAAGTSRVLDFAEVETVLRLPRTWFPPQGEIYAMRIEDDSMAPVISDGSLVFVDTSKRNRETLVDKLVAARVDDKVTIRSLQRIHQSFFISHSAADTESVRTLVRSFKQTIIGEVVMWMSRPQPGSTTLVALYRNEIEEMVDALVENRRSLAKQSLGKTISELVKSKRVDATLGRLIMIVIEIGNKVAHGIEITREDFEQVSHFMPIIRSSLKVRRPPSDELYVLAPPGGRMVSLEE